MKIIFEYAGKELEGTIITEKNNELTIKLDSGYNIIVPKNDIKIIKEEKLKATTKKINSVSQNPKLPKITILHTGGTVASKIDYSTGAVIAGYSAEDIIGLFPEITTIANISSKLISNIQSEMMRFGHWNLLIKGVEEAIKNGAEGVIITHGTDILHMSSAALSFALENINIPVIFVGSQRSSDRPSSDAISNLLCATKFIAESNFKGVATCMHENIEKDDCIIINGCKSRKMHTSRRDAFKVINDTPYARISYPKLEITKLKEYPKGNKLKATYYNEKLKIGLSQFHPQFFAEELKVYENFDGLILGLLGIGHGPTMHTDNINKEHKIIYDELKKLSSKIVVAGAPQTIYGRINMNVYTPGKQLQELGVLGQNLDMTPETAFVKLAWLLSNYSVDEAKKLYSQNLRGEITTRTEKNTYE